LYCFSEGKIGRNVIRYFQSCSSTCCFNTIIVADSFEYFRSFLQFSIGIILAINFVFLPVPQVKILIYLTRVTFVQLLEFLSVLLVDLAFFVNQFLRCKDLESLS
jgi:hypothetical protein